MDCSQSETTGTILSKWHLKCITFAYESLIEKQSFNTFAKRLCSAWKLFRLCCAEVQLRCKTS